MPIETSLAATAQRLWQAYPRLRPLAGLVPSRVRVAVAARECARRVRRPIVIHIETTTFCNARCAMCPHSIMPRRNRHMDDATFDLVLEQMAELSVVRVNLSVIGEPLLDPKICDRVRAVCSRGYRTRIITNASMLKPATSERLIEAGLDELFVSLNGLDAESHQRVMRYRTPCRQQCVDNVLAFADLNRALSGGRVRMHLGSLLDRDPFPDEADRFREGWHSQGFEVSVGRPVQWHRAENAGLSGRCYPCPYVFSEMVIDCTGKVIACCRDYRSSTVQGDVHEERLATIWTGEAVRAFRRLHRAGRASRSPLCASCEVPREMNWKEVIRDLAAS